MRRSCPSALGAVGLLVAACSAAPPNRPKTPLRYPPPPIPTRVELLQIVRGPEDWGIDQGAWTRLGRALTGGDPPRFARPFGVAVGPRNLLVVADPGIPGVHVLEGDRGVYRLLRAAGQTPLQMPVAVALDAPRYEMFVADAQAGAVHCLRLDGKLLWTARKDLERPAGIALDARARRLYVADAARHHIVVFDLKTGKRRTLGRRGTRPGTFNFPTHLAVDRRGMLYVNDTLNFRVQVLRPDGHALGVIGRAGSGTGQMARPKGVATDSDGHVYVSDALFDAFQIFDRKGRFLLGIGLRGQGFGELEMPAGLAIDRRDRIFVADSFNHRLQVFQYFSLTE